MKQTDNTFKRRKFLGATGALAFGSNRINDKFRSEDNKYGEIQFIEIGKVNEVDLPDVNGTFQYSTIDDRIYHRVDPSDGQLYIEEATDESVKDLFATEEKVLKFVDYFGIPTSAQQDSIRNVVIGLGRAYRRTGALVTSNPYRRPPVRVEPKEDMSIRILIEGEEAIVEAKSNETIVLAPRSVKLPFVRQLDEKVRNEDIPEHKRANKQVKDETTVTVVPSLYVRNYGELDVIESPTGGTNQ
jgi:hypothetical protein